MHIPGKLEASKRTPATRFFRQHRVLTREQMVSPQAQRAAKNHADDHRISTWQKCCEQANAIARKRALGRLAMRDLLNPENLALHA